MTITSADGADFAAACGISRVVVGRELSVRDIGKVSAGSHVGEIEAFCHGALCVSYSGQCFSSEAWGGRSANRGQCAQVRTDGVGGRRGSKVETLPLPRRTGQPIFPTT